MNIGKAIKKGLNKKDWSQRKFAKLMGVSPGLVSQWINNKTTPPGDILIKIAQTLEIVNELFLEKVNPKYENCIIREPNNSELYQKVVTLEKRLSELELKINQHET